MKSLAARHRLIEPLQRRRFQAFGSRSIVDRPVWLYGSRHISIGSGSVILEGAWLSVERTAWDGDGPILRIGNGVWIRPFSAISASSSVVLEDDVVLGTMVSIVDSNHTREADHPNVLWNPSASTPIHIGKGTWIGDKSTILAGSHIGEGCFIGANSVVRGTVPDYSIAVGAPARVVGTSLSPH